MPVHKLTSTSTPQTWTSKKQFAKTANLNLRLFSGKKELKQQSTDHRGRSASYSGGGVTARVITTKNRGPITVKYLSFKKRPLHIHYGKSSRPTNKPSTVEPAGPPAAQPTQPTVKPSRPTPGQTGSS